jgi:hypothetical protein
MNQLKLEKEARKRLLAAYLLEAQRILKEQAPVPPTPGASAVPPSPVPPAQATNTSAAMPPAPPVPGAQPGQDGQPKPFDVDSMIERMNIIRGGRSFADPEVYGQLTAYFKGLNETDKAVIDRFLQDVNKIVIQVDTTQQVAGGGGGAQPPVAPPAAAPGAAPAAPAAGVPGM